MKSIHPHSLTQHSTFQHDNLPPSAPLSASQFRFQLKLQLHSNCRLHLQLHFSGSSHLHLHLHSSPQLQSQRSTPSRRPKDNWRPQHLLCNNLPFPLIITPRQINHLSIPTAIAIAIAITTIQINNIPVTNPKDFITASSRPHDPEELAVCDFEAWASV